MPKLNIRKTREMLQRFDFKSLFIEELGWDRHAGHHQVTVDQQTFTISAIAHKRGVQILECAPDSEGRIPEYAIRRKIEQRVTKLAHEHLVIFVDREKTTQIWQWVSREPGQAIRYHEYTYHAGQSGEALLQKLEYLTFPLSVEESLTISGVTIKLRDAFQRERVTRRFYDRFKDEHAAFLKFIDGIPDKEMERWYASVMINRLMFIYFVQKKGFLDGDQDYLKNKLAESKRRGKDLFYKLFLCPLFFKGFAEKDRSPETRQLLGDIPYFNGGLFLKHQIEQLRGKAIQIPDKAFEKLFQFFDQWRWHLDERPLRDDKEINPDVLGYIFEKYINQKQMGAYYTKEDITGYISKNTIIPFLFDAARKSCRIAFEGEQSVWRLLEDNPDRYIYKAVRHGVSWDIHTDTPLDAPLPLPPEIEEGLDTSKPNLLERRKAWNRAAPPEYALPTEIWREVVARRRRYEEVRSNLAAGEVRDINDLITYNLDIIQFAQDVIENCEGPELLRAFWHAIVGRIPEKSNEKFQAGVSILDPACGSGAFLFAALNILEPLYEACLVRMEAFLGDLERSGERHRPEKFADFRSVLERVRQHPNRRYFILKSIIVNNLFGVDIMEEAVEICKLRLFLKLVAQIEGTEHIEPLPDIDFNIRAGNTLVGYPTYNDVMSAVTSKLAFDDTIARIEEKANDVDRLFDLFRQQQIEIGGEIKTADKNRLRDALKVVEAELNSYLAGDYGIKANDRKGHERWINSHKPFHWFLEFHSIMKDGGFDVIIGNPPYVELSDVTDDYSVRGLSLLPTGNLYSIFVERFTQLLRETGRCGVIIPISSVSTPRMLPLMRLLTSAFSPLHLSNFAVRPGKLFFGVDMNLTIVVGEKSARGAAADKWSTKYNRWEEQYRPFLFNTLTYAPTKLCAARSSIPKIGSAEEEVLMKKLESFPTLLRYRTATNNGEVVYYHSGGRYFRKCLREQLSNEYKELPLSKPFSDAAICLLSSSLYYWFWIAISDCYHVTRRDVDELPTPESLAQDSRLNKLAESLIRDLYENATMRVRNRADGSQQKELNFQVGKSKGIIDNIDCALSNHYGLTPEELDATINYDIKYRGDGIDG
jgi:hypothetical protein